MELPKIPKPNGSMFSDLKSKLGFSGQKDDDYRDGYADEGYDDYGEEYGDYGADYAYDEGYDEAYDGRRPYASRGYSSAPGSPNLVSFEDVRARTQIPDSLNRDPLPARTSSAGSYGSRGGRVTVAADDINPAMPAARRGSEGLDSLFSSTTDAPYASSGGYAAASDSPVAASALSGASYGSASYDGPSFVSPYAAASAGSGQGAPSAPASAGAASAYDPFDAYRGAGSAMHAPTRGLVVIKPAEYGEVERVAKALKAGDAAVLCLRNTPDHLAKRILDFSFGVASYAEANVDCVADKVFVVVRGSKLSDAELLSLRGQGVL